MMTESIPETDLANLRNDLMRSGLDSFQAAELLSAFLIERGYGVSHTDARHAASLIESMGCNLACMRAEIERIALVM